MRFASCVELRRAIQLCRISLLQSPARLWKADLGREERARLIRLLTRPHLRSRLADFGIVRDHHDDQNITGPDIIAGTPRFMAPEQAMGDPVDGRTDIYSLGVLRFWMLLGRTPFHERKGTRALLAHIQSPPPAFSAVNPFQARSRPSSTRRPSGRRHHGTHGKVWCVRW